MTEYVYRPMKRRLPDGEWSQVSTYGSSYGKRSYTTIGAARGVLTREKREDAGRRSRGGDPELFWEYKIQRRPLGEWEDA